MAKSLRSKRRRKVRAEKRLVNAKKELDKLRQVAARLHGADRATRERLAAEMPDVELAPAEAPMAVDGAHSGHHPEPNTRPTLQINNQWMNQRRIKAIKQKIKRSTQKRARHGNSAGLSSRKTRKNLKKR